MVYLTTPKENEKKKKKICIATLKKNSLSNYKNIPICGKIINMKKTQYLVNGIILFYVFKEKRKAKLLLSTKKKLLLFI